MSIVLAALLAVPGLAAEALKTDQDKALYALGFQMAKNVGSLRFTPKEADAVIAGARDAVLGKPAGVNLPIYQPKIDELIQQKLKAITAENKKAGAAFAAKFAKETGVSELKGGGFIKHEKEGSGAAPSESDTVKVHYKGTLIDGTEFDSSFKRGQPAEFPLGNVIPCWTNGVAKMKVGGKARLVCPSDVAYGDNGHPPVIPGGSTLVFDVELLEIVKK